MFPRRIEIAALVLPSVLLAFLVAFDYLVLEPNVASGPRHVALLVLGIAGILAFSFAIFSRLTELQLRERDLAQQLEQRGQQLEALNQAGLSLAADLETSSVLQRISDLARDVARARYAALGIFNENGEVVQFLTSGLTPQERERIGPLPRGRGLLGLLQDEPRAIRVPELSKHPASVGFPPGHPPMHSFLGVPIRWRDRSLGNLYLTEKIGAGEFSVDDENAIRTLAAQAAIAIENARLIEQVGRISVLEERQRIGMDLHDGAMQSLYGLGLLLEDAAQRTGTHPEAARTVIERSVELLNGTIAELRRYVTGLRPIRGVERPLSEALPGLAQQMGRDALLEVTIEVDPDAERDLDREQREATFYIAADALTNIARHARAHSVHVRFGLEDGPRAVLEVRDDGIGFEPGQGPSGFGLRNMRERAFVAGGRLHVASAPGRGTLVRLELPLEREVAR